FLPAFPILQLKGSSLGAGGFVMRWLLVERLRPFVLVAFGASAGVHFALVVAALCALQLLDRPLLLGAVVLLGALVVYTGDRIRGDAVGSAVRAVDRDLVPAAI